MKLPCDCCEGPRVLTPLATLNRPGLSKLRYRVGTHASFFETMQARLSSEDYLELAGLKTREKSDPSIALLDAWATVGDVLTFYQERIANEGYLRTATERRSVLELARLIGYALRPGVAASVYLAYSIERDAAPVEVPKGARSNSVPGPGEQMQAFETAEPFMARFEWNEIKPRLTQPQTAESIKNVGLYLKGIATNLKVNDPLLIDLADEQGLRFARVDKVETDGANDRTRVVLRGIDALQDAAASVIALLSRFSDLDRFEVSPDAAMAQRVLAVMKEVARAAERSPREVAAHLEAEALPKLAEEFRTAVAGHFTKLAPWIDGLSRELKAARGRLLAAVGSVAGGMATTARASVGTVGILGGVIDTLKLAPSVPPTSSKQLERSIEGSFGKSADAIPHLLTVLQPALQNVFYTAWRNLPPPMKVQIEAYTLRVAAAPFGHNAPLRQTAFNTDTNIPTFDEWDINDPWNQGSYIDITAPPGGEPAAAVVAVTPDFHKPRELYLDNDYDIAPDSLIAIEKSGESPIIVAAADSIVHRSLVAYSLSGKTVQINLPEDKEWIAQAPNEPFATVRNSRVYAGSEKLDLTEEPMTDDVADKEIELSDLYEDLEPGRWLIVSGERSDIKDASGTPVAGVKAVELVMLAAVTQKIREENGKLVAGDTIHTFITLAESLAYKYKRDTVVIYGNVVKATHGETRQEVLGGGDAAKAFQQFTLKQPPLTYVSAPTASGVESTLEVRVNEVKWHEADSLADLGLSDRRFLTRTDDDAKTTVIFGNGERGARLPTGQENIKATYRNGIGKPGNVKAEQISLLSTRPLGAKGVINPIRASGGADKESRDQARKHAPLAVMALDRLVSTQDYADFARTFAGIGKAAAARLTDGRRQIVQVTIAGADDIPIETSSDLYRNLYDALHRFGDPHLPIRLEVRERLALIVSAKVRIHPDYLWDALEPKIRTAVLDTFGFEPLALGEDLLLSDAIRVMQGVTGVLYVDIEVFDAISELQLLQGFAAPAAKNLKLNERIVVEPDRVLEHKLLPAQLAYLTPEVPDTLILQELKP